MRLFVALDLPENIKDKLHSFEDKALKGARWTSAEQWHITLHFIGESDDVEIRDALATINAEAFVLKLSGVGTFPERGQPNVLWLGIDVPSALKTLHQVLGEALKTTGFVPEKRPYSPHLTLARFKETKPYSASMTAYLQKYARFETDSFPIRAFSLYQSELLKSGAVYTLRESFPLIEP